MENMGVYELTESWEKVLFHQSIGLLGGSARYWQIYFDFANFR